MNRILILGPSGSGKTSLASRLSDDLHIPAYDLDDIFWVRKYDRKRNERRCEEMLTELARKPQWIIEGAYSRWIEPAVKASDYVVLLDIPFTTLFWRLVYRGFTRRAEKDLKSLYCLVKYAYNYRRKGQNAGYHMHVGLIDKHKKKFVKIRNNHEIENLLEKLIR